MRTMTALSNLSGRSVSKLLLFDCSASLCSKGRHLQQLSLAASSVRGFADGPSTSTSSKCAVAFSSTSTSSADVALDRQRDDALRGAKKQGNTKDENMKDEKKKKMEEDNEKKEEDVAAVLLFVRSMQEKMSEQGAILQKNVEARICPEASRGLGLFSCESVQRDQVSVSVPNELCIVAPFPTDGGPDRDDDKLRDRPGEWDGTLLGNARRRQSVVEVAQQVMMIMLQNLQSEAVPRSHLEAYCAALPRPPPDCDFTAFLGQNKRLRETFLHSFASRWRSQSEDVLRLLSDFGQREDSELTGSEARQLARASLFAVVSRAFVLPSGGDCSEQVRGDVLALVPLVDLSNHWTDDGGQGSMESPCYVSMESGKVSLVAGRTLLAGEELTHSYCEGSDAALFFQYAILPELDTQGANALNKAELHIGRPAQQEGDDLQHSQHIFTLPDDLERLLAFASSEAQALTSSQPDPPEPARLAHGWVSEALDELLDAIAAASERRPQATAGAAAAAAAAGVGAADLQSSAVFLADSPSFAQQTSKCLKMLEPRGPGEEALLPLLVAEAVVLEDSLRVLEQKLLLLELQASAHLDRAIAPSRPKRRQRRPAR